MTITKELNDYLKEVIRNSYKCAHCTFNHSEICFFAYECIKKDFQNFTEED